MRVARLLPFWILVLLGCASDDATPRDASPEPSQPDPPGAATDVGTHALYELGPAPMQHGAVPYPDDAYRDDQGRVRVRDIPSAASAAFRNSLAAGMSELDGFGARPVVSVRFSSALDESSMPADPEETEDADASVFLIDADTTSTWAFQRIPVEVRWVDAARALRIVPAYGRPLAAGRRYAAVVTTRVLDAGGDPIEPAPQLARILRASQVLDAADERAARARYEPVLSALAARGLPRSQVAAIAVFTVQSAGNDLQDARALLHERAAAALAFDRVVAPEELDATLGLPAEGAAGLDDGAPHDRVGVLAHGHIQLPSLISDSSAVHGSVSRDDSARLLVRGSTALPFSLWLPRNVSPSAPLPLLVVLHDEGGERSDAAAIANALCGRGYAVVAPDAPFHGMRLEENDAGSRFTGYDVPDGFGDQPGDFPGLTDNAGPLPAGHPLYYRDAVRQAAFETMGLLRALSEADFDAFAEQHPALAPVRLQTARIALLGTGLGAELVVLVAPLEPAVDAAVLAFAGGMGVDAWLQAPASRSHAEAFLARLGRTPDDVDWDADPPWNWPDVDAFRAFTDRGSALAQAALLRRSPTNLLVLMAEDDERAPNARTEALAAALGARLAVDGSPVDPELISDERLSGDTVRANVSVEAGDLTRTLVVLDPATHDALVLERGKRAFEGPVSAPPFEELDEPETVANPTADAMMQIAYFFESLRGCEPAARSPCSATALVP